MLALLPVSFIIMYLAQPLAWICPRAMRTSPAWVSPRPTPMPFGHPAPPRKDGDGNALYYTGKMTIGHKTGVSVNLSEDCVYTMSSFSSWGVPSNLTLKPEITAPGRQYLFHQRRYPENRPVCHHERYLHGFSP